MTALVGSLCAIAVAVFGGWDAVAAFGVGMALMWLLCREGL